MNLTRIAPIGFGIVLAALTFGSLDARAQVSCGTCIPPTDINYTISLPYYNVSDIVIFGENQDGGTGQQGTFTALAGTTPTTISYLTTQTIVTTFMMGVTFGIPNESSGALVLFTNNAFAATATGQDFGTLYSALLSYSLWYTDAGGVGSIGSESTLVNDLINDGANGLPNAGFGPPNSGNDLDLTHFIGGYTNASLAGAMASAGFAPGDPFTAVAFSGGQIIGTGVSSIPGTGVSSVPEPATWAMMLIGFGLVGFRLRRSARSA
jgi:hypothetical protein